MRVRLRLMDPRTDLGPRIIVTGRPGAGKTRLARELASHLRRDLIRLDPLITDEHSRRKPEEDIAPALSAVARQEEWVLEGMGQDIPQHAWKRATTVIWLDLRRGILIWRLFKRAFPKKLARLPVWGGIRYTLVGHRAERARLERYVRENAPRSSHVIRMSSTKQYRELIGGLPGPTGGRTRVIRGKASRRLSPPEDTLQGGMDP